MLDRSAKRVWLMAFIVAGMFAIGLLINVLSPRPYEAERYSQNVNQYDSGELSSAGVLIERIERVLERHEKSLLVLSSVIIACFTGTLWWSTYKLWQDASKTSKRADAALRLSEKEYLSTHRPKLIVRKVALYLDGDDDMGAAWAEKSWIEFTVVNVGETDAAIVESNATAYIVKSDQPGEKVGEYGFYASLPFDEHRNVISNTVIQPGVAQTFSKRTVEFNLVSAKWSVIAGYARLYFLGYIIYEDGVGIRRRTQFCREYSRETQGFSVADAEHEYAD